MEKNNENNLTTDTTADVKHMNDSKGSIYM